MAENTASAAAGSDAHDLEIADGDTEAIRRQVRSQPGGQPRTDLYGVNRCPSREEVLRRLARSGANLDDVRLGGQHLEERLEQVGGIRGPHSVIDVGGLVEREPDVVRRLHGDILPESRTYPQVPYWTSTERRLSPGSRQMQIGIYVLDAPSLQPTEGVDAHL